jgi:hypothetical protein
MPQPIIDHQQVRFNQFSHQFLPGLLQAAQVMVIDLLELCLEGLVEFRQIEKIPVPQGRQHPSSTTCTPTSTLALSLGFQTRAGITASP